MWLNRSDKQQESWGSTGLIRLVLYSGEVCRLPQTVKEIRVVSGNAWVTVNGTDMMLGDGEKQSLATQKDFALVSALRHTPLVIELRRDDQSSPEGIHLTPCLQLG